MSLKPKLREQEGAPYIPDNKNYIVNLQIGKPLQIDEIVKKLSIPGVLATGLFLNMCSGIIAGTERGVEVIKNIHVKRA